MNRKLYRIYIVVFILATRVAFHRVIIIFLSFSDCYYSSSNLSIAYNLKGLENLYFNTGSFSQQF